MDQGSNDDASIALSRRETIAASGALLFGAAPQTVGARDGATTVVLGAFDEDRDGWKTNGGTELSLVPHGDTPRAATIGEQALSVDGGQDPVPLVWRTADDANVAEFPHLVASVYVEQIEEYQGTVSVELRYRYDRSGGRDGRDSGKPVETFESREVPQEFAGDLSWDLSDVADWKLENPNRIELLWYRTEAPQTEPKRGGGPGDPYGGRVHFDRIWLTDQAQRIEEDAYVRHVSTLRAEHGRPSYEFDGVEDGVEHGTFVFFDDTEVPVETEILGDERLRYTVGEETFELGGEWE